MAWKKVSPEVCFILEEALVGYPVRERRMFGSPSFFVNDNMFAGAHEESVFLRLSQRDRKEIMEASDEVGLFEPLAGKPMREYVSIPEPLLSDRDWFQDWIERSFSFALSLPPGKKKTKNK